MIETHEEQAQKPSSGEFEREPVPKSALLGFKSFIGMYAGEHCAGTELMIGPLFVAAGVSAFDVVVGLLVGNALAVVSWVLLCAPIATRARLTLYYQLEKICGRCICGHPGGFNYLGQFMPPRQSEPKRRLPFNLEMTQHEEWKITNNSKKGFPQACCSWHRRSIDRFWWLPEK